MRARSLAIYQLSYNGALALGAFGWGWLGDLIGLSWTLACGRAAPAPLLAFAVRGFSLDHDAGSPAGSAAAGAPLRDAPAADSLPMLSHGRGAGNPALLRRSRTPGRVPGAMAEVRRVRGRAGALSMAAL